MYSKRSTLPSYRNHKASGQAIVTLSGRDIYLGPFGTRHSRDEYDRVVCEWLAAGRAQLKPDLGEGISVTELLLAYTQSEDVSRHDHKAVVKALRRHYGEHPASDFGPLALEAIRNRMIESGLARTTINYRVYCIRNIFRWGVSRELIDPFVLERLKSVANLKQGKSEAPDPVKVEPVAIDHVNACLPFMAPIVQAMVKVQFYTGMRSGELCRMRTGEIDMTGKIWLYTPEKHKSENKGKSREITIGQRAQDALRPYLKPDLQAFVFSPAEADDERKEIATAARRTPLSCGNRPGSNRVRRPSRRPGECYAPAAYLGAIEYATWKAFPEPMALAKLKGETTTAWRARLGDRWADVLEWRKRHHWHPHQLRHTIGTEVRERLGPEHAQATLGHAHIKATEIYAEVSRKRAIEVATAIG